MYLINKNLYLDSHDAWFDIYFVDKNLKIVNSGSKSVYLTSYKIKLRHGPNNATTLNAPHSTIDKSSDNRSFKTFTEKDSFISEFVEKLKVPIYLSHSDKEKNYYTIYQFFTDFSGTKIDETIVTNSFSYHVGDYYDFEIELIFNYRNREKFVLKNRGTLIVDSERDFTIQSLDI